MPPFSRIQHERGGMREEKGRTTLSSFARSSSLSTCTSTQVNFSSLFNIQSLARRPLVLFARVRLLLYHEQWNEVDTNV